MQRRTLLETYAVTPLTTALSTPPKIKGPRANYFPNFALRTHEGKTVRFYDDLIQGKTVVLNVMYAECEGICPGMTANLVKVQKLLGDRVGRDLFFYSLTLQPVHDTPQVLHHYAQMHGIKAGWQLLTGKPAEMEILRRKLGFFDPDPVVDADKSQHLGLVRYGNEAVDRWAACPALANPQQIVSAILRLEPPAKSNGRRTTNK